uniref:NIDO domain-containing protein n=1 Tax=Parastrongyloides trichosuri TaxID=131310 RepID=A0A0N4ZX96_PARTI
MPFLTQFLSDEKGQLKLSELKEPIDISRPRFDQSKFTGRLKRFFGTINPFFLLFSNKYLEECKTVVKNYNKGIIKPNMTVDELWMAKRHYDSAYHPETGEKTFILGRMSAQAPCNAFIKGGMLAFYKNPYAVFFWHYFNQAHGAMLNYCNRSGKAGSGDNVRLMTAFGCATTAGVGTALGLNHVIGNMKLPPIINRFVPFIASSIAMSTNIPIMRQREFIEGIAVKDDKDVILGRSTVAAKWAVSTVILCRILMAAPYMIISPIVMNRVAKTAFYDRNKWISAPLQCFLTFVILSFSAPIGCSIFPQRGSIHVTSLEPELREKLSKLPNPPSIVYYNKGHNRYKRTLTQKRESGLDLNVTVPYIFSARLYPYGKEHNDYEMIKNKDELFLSTPLYLLGIQYDKIYIHRDGIVTFNSHAVGEPKNFPIDEPLIAVYWMKSKGGKIWFRESKDPSIIDSTKNEVNIQYKYGKNYKPDSVVIITWENTQDVNVNNDDGNIFQIALILSEKYGTFAHIVYSKLSSNNDAIVGFHGEPGLHYFNLPGSGTEDSILLGDKSDIGIPGEWLFRIDTDDQIYLCGSGSKGMECVESCSPNQWYMDCTRECHCESNLPCNPDDGHCPSGRCNKGWRGAPICDRDIDECTESPNICPIETPDCINTPGAHICMCLDYNNSTKTCNTSKDKKKFNKQHDETTSTHSNIMDGPMTLNNGKQITDVTDKISQVSFYY